VLLIAGGVGITPLRALFETLPGGPGDVTLLYRASHELDVVLSHELDDIAARRGSRVHYAIGPRNGPHGDPLSARNLRRQFGDLRHSDVYLCGPVGMTTAARRTLRELGVPAARIHDESFTF
jgi:ferredoxin-NADP reductase